MPPITPITPRKKTPQRLPPSVEDDHWVADAVAHAEAWISAGATPQSREKRAQNLLTTLQAMRDGWPKATTN